MANEEKKKYYKAFNSDLSCNGFKYEIGKIYKIDESPILCERGFHFCDNIINVYRFYAMGDDTRVCEVEPLGKIISDKDGIKFVTNEIKIVKEIKHPRSLTNIDTNSSGYCNSGNKNSGNRNSGHCNSGNCNSGNHNSDDLNSGHYNSGYCNSGDINSGNYNSGDWNNGNYNCGNCNSGDWDSGSYNSGDENSGYYNSGDWNSGDWNSGNRNSGIFNTDKAPKIKMFNKESSWTYADWYASKACDIMIECPYTHSDFISQDVMTDEEKENHPEYKTIGGYVKVIIVTAVDRQKWWNDLDDADKREVLSLPNFDAKIFKECTEIDVENSEIDETTPEVEKDD